MSQKTPGNEPLENGGNDDVVDNPYFRAAEQQQAPDLDSAAPVLRNEEGQRVNRKALLFLAGIVALLILAVFLLFSSAGKKKEAPADQATRSEQPFIPENLPSAAAPPLPPPPAAVEEMPPLPAFEPVPMMPVPQMPAQPPVQTGPSLVQRRMGDAAGAGGMDTPFGAGGNPYAQMAAMQQAQLSANPYAAQQAMQAQQEQQGGQDQLQLADVAQAGYLRRPDNLLLRGTYIRCVLETRLVTDHPGFTSCIVTEPVYSVNGGRLLLPRGSKVSGTYGSTVRSERVAVVWDRITTPTGLDVRMASPGVDNLGGAGHVGDLDNHWASRITSALMISLVADGFKYAAAEHGPREDEVTNNGNIVSRPYESATARTMERLANEALNNAMGRGPTVTINQGTVLNIYVAQDVDFTAVLPPLR